MFSQSSQQHLDISCWNQWKGNVCLQFFENVSCLYKVCLKKSDPQLVLKTGLKVVESLLKILPLFISLVLFFRKGGRGMCHQGIRVSYQYFCLTVAGEDQIFFSLLSHSFLVRSCTKAHGENVWMVTCIRLAPYALPLPGGLGSQRVKGPSSSCIVLGLLNAACWEGRGGWATRWCELIFMLLARPEAPVSAQGENLVFLPGHCHPSLLSPFSSSCAWDHPGRERASNLHVRVKGRRRKSNFPCDLGVWLEFFSHFYLPWVQWPL